MRSLRLVLIESRCVGVRRQSLWCACSETRCQRPDVIVLLPVTDTRLTEQGSCPWTDPAVLLPSIDASSCWPDCCRRSCAPVFKSITGGCRIKTPEFSLVLHHQP